MKKKILSLIIAVLLLIPCFALNISATSGDIKMQPDYQTLTLGGNTYVRFDSSFTEWDYGDSLSGAECDIAEVKYVDYDLSINNTIIVATIYFTDGSSLNASYINQKYYAEHQVLTAAPSEYTIDFAYPTGNEIAASHNAILGESATLTQDQLWYYESFDVNAKSQSDEFYVKKGTVLLIDEIYYYVDYNLSDVKDPYNFYPEDYENLQAYKITDTELLAQLDAAYGEYNSDFLGLLGSDFTNVIATVFLSIAFAVIPLAALIVFLILAIKTKTPTYKKMFTAIYITAAVELVVFAITVMLIIVS